MKYLSKTVKRICGNTEGPSGDAIRLWLEPGHVLQQDRIILSESDDEEPLMITVGDLYAALCSHRNADRTQRERANLQN